MNSKIRNITAGLFVLAILQTVAAQELPVDRVTVPFSDPVKPGLVKAGLIYGSITVKGYAGKEVIIEASSRTRKYSNRDSDEQRQGLKRIKIASTGLTVEEEENVMNVSVSSHMRTVDLKIQVPAKTSVKLSTINNGDIFVENVEGEIELNNTNGRIEALNVSGTVLANTTNGKVVVTLKKVDAEKPMSFVSFNGNVDVTLPATTRANLKMKSEQGDIFSDFDISLEEKNKLIKEDKRKKGGKYRIRVESAMYGMINGGGPEYYFSTYNGDIFIRKGK